MIVSTLPVSVIANANANMNTQKSLYEELLEAGKLVPINSDSSNSISEEVALSNSAVESIDNSRIIDEIGLSSDDVESFYRVSYSYNDDIAYESDFSDGSIITYDKDMSVLSYTNFERDSESSSSKNTAIINTMKSEFNIDNSYAFSTDNNDNNDVVYYWEKTDENGYRNIYDSLSVRIDGTTNSIVMFNRFTDEYSDTTINIDAKSASAIALSVNDKFESITSIVKEYGKPNFFWNKGKIAYNEADIVKLVYDITIDEIYKVYVDCETGEVIGGDILKAVNNCGTYAYDGFDYSTASRNLARKYLKKLGYTSTSTMVDDEDLRDEVLDFVRNDPKAYGFYIDCHGSTTLLSTDENDILSYTEVLGNWHFVFLDACSTAANTNWSNKFHISSSYSKRAFFGWRTTVGITNAYTFCSAFWPETYNRNHSNNVRDAAVWAAAQVPGSGTTPIKFYGDTSYNGRAY